MSPSVLVSVLTLIFVVTCCVTDIRTREIPNELSGGTMLLGILCNALLFGPAGIAMSLVGAILCIAILLPPFALGGVGGGDVKMMGAIGALLGPRLALFGLAAGMILGGAVMSLHLMRRGRLREKLQSTWSMARRSVSDGSLDPLRISDQDDGAVTLPYSIPLGAGTVLVMAAAWSGLS